MINYKIISFFWNVFDPWDHLQHKCFLPLQNTHQHNKVKVQRKVNTTISSKCIGWPRGVAIHLQKT